MATTASSTIPQPRPSKLLGNIPDLDSDNVVRSLGELAAQYGPIYRLQMPKADLIVVSSQKLVDELCDEKRFDKKVHGALREIRNFAGDGLFTAATKDPQWGIAHRVLMPAFGPAAMRNMFDGMLDIAGQMLLKWERMGPSQRIDVPDNMTRLTLDTIALCAFDYRFNSFYETGMHPFVGAMVRALEESGARTRRLPLQTKLMLITQRQYAEDVKLMHQIADELIVQRKRASPGGVVQARPDNDLLGIMLSGRDPVTGEGLSDVNVRNQMVTFLIAGHETTSGLLSFALYLLLENPHVLERARDEADRVFDGQAPRFEHLSQLVVIDQVLKETLRLWPTAPAFAVYPRDEHTTLGGTHTVRKNEVLLALLPALHRDPDVWGPDPESFRPERFEHDRAATLPPNAWKPFGNGQRACIGRPFAMQEASLLLAMILQRFELSKADPDYRLVVKETLTLKPDGFFMKARLRGNAVGSRGAGGSGGITARGPGANAGIAAGTVAGMNVPEPPMAVASNGIAVAVLYGSNGGSAEAFARRIANDARVQGYVPTIAPLDTAAGHLPAAAAFIIVTASYEGYAPDNARAFLDWIESVTPGSLPQVRFAVFGCGNRDWARTYQAIPKRVDAAMDRAGGQRLAPRGEADARGDFFGDFDRWYADFWNRMGAAFGQEARVPAPLPELELEFVHGARDAMLRHNDLQFGEVVENRELVDLVQAPGRPPGRSKRHLEIALPPGNTYQPGDYLVVLPTNPVANVDRALRRFGLSYDAQILIRVNAHASTFLPTDRPVMAGEVLYSYVELGVPASRRQIELLSVSTPCPPERQALDALVADDETYRREVLDRRVSVLDLVERFASCELPFSAFLQMLSPLKPRQYSISSSPAWSAENCTVTVAVVHGPALSGQGTYRGAASNYLGQAQPGARIAVSTRPSVAAFHPPRSLDVPMIMVGAGTGMAPFRGFLQDRALRLVAEGSSAAPALLFFGCDHPDVDFLYRDELAAWEAQGVVSVRPAFSAAPEGGAVFVQHRLWNDRVEVMDLIGKGARIYVCGDGKFMAPAVRDTFGRMFQEIGERSTDEVEAWLADLERNIRYVQDVFA